MASPSVPAAVGLFPVGAYAPETGLVGGAFAQWMGTRDSLQRPDQAALWLTLAVKGQAELGLRPEWWSSGMAWNASGEISYQQWPARWHGVGPDSPAQAQDFSSERVKLEGSLRRRLAPGLFGGLSVLRTQERLSGQAAQGDLRQSAGRDVGLGVELALDTRDDTVWPRRGCWMQGKVLRHGELAGGEWAYARWVVDVRDYRALAGGVWATQVAVEGRGGEPPLRALPRLGEWLRAVDELRWVDRWTGALRVEWRQDLPFALPTPLGKALSRRGGWVFFAEGGRVAGHAEALAKGPHAWSIGLGGRLALLPRERLNARADLAFGREGAALRIKVGEEF